MPNYHRPTIIASLGAGTVVENPLSLLLEGFGYSARLLEYTSAADAGEQPLLEELYDVDVVVITPPERGAQRRLP